MVLILEDEPCGTTARLLRTDTSESQKRRNFFSVSCTDVLPSGFLLKIVFDDCFSIYKALCMRFAVHVKFFYDAAS